MNSSELAELIKETILYEVKNKKGATSYRDPIIGFVAADDPEFAKLSELVEFQHLMPEDLLQGARSVVCFYLPFVPEIVYPNQEYKKQVAREWGVAYYETNALIGYINRRLIEVLKEHGVNAAAEPATGNFDSNELRSHWSHKSIAVMTGIGSFGLHQLIITDAGCTGRFGTLVIDAELPIDKPERKERCEYFDSGTCMDCVIACPANALSKDERINRADCWELLLENRKGFLDIGDNVHVCGKCAVVGPCAFESAV